MKLLSNLLNEKVIGTLIALNALITVYLGFDKLPFIQEITYIDNLITLLFVSEIILKIVVYKRSFFKFKWNWFDLIVITISFIALLLQFSDLEFNIIENFVIFRTIRLFKFFRMVKIIPNIEKIFSDLKKAVRVTSGIIIGGFIILIIVGVVLNSIYKNFDPVNFGDPIVSMYSVFRIFSVEGWYEIPDAMTAKTSYVNATFIRFLFSALVLFGMFMLGFIISSISDELAIDNNDELISKTKELENKIDKLNEKIDLLMSNH